MITRIDSELVMLTAAGHADAYAELYRRYCPAARRRAYQLAPCGTDANDLVADAFTKVLAAIQAGCRPDPFVAYLLTTIRHDVALLYKQREQRRVVSLCDIPASAEIVATSADPAGLCDTEPVRQAFRTLPARWRVALWLNTVEARTPAELATLLGLTPNGAAALTCRARRGLRQAHAEVTAGQRRFARSCSRHSPTPSAVSQEVSK